MRSNTCWPRSARRRRPRAYSRAISLMSAPATKALSPAPGQDDAADGFVLLKVEDSLPDFVEGRRVERVQALGALNREHRHPASRWTSRLSKDIAHSEATPDYTPRPHRAGARHRADRIGSHVENVERSSRHEH